VVEGAVVAASRFAQPTAAIAQTPATAAIDRVRIVPPG
jgi:hypothetical protein